MSTLKLLRGLRKKRRDAYIVAVKLAPVRRSAKRNASIFYVRVCAASLRQAQLSAVRKARLHHDRSGGGTCSCYIMGIVVEKDINHMQMLVSDFLSDKKLGRRKKFGSSRRITDATRPERRKWLEIVRL